MPPLQALYGQQIPDLNRYQSRTSNTTSIDAALTELQRLRTVLKDNLRRAQQRMTTLANTHRLDKEFQVGDMVYLRLKEYRQKTIHSRDTKKLTKRYFGHFKVLERIGKVTYRLQLLPESRIHPVFYVSLLCQAYGNPTPTPLPQWEAPGESSIPPLKDELVAKVQASDTSLIHTNPTDDHQRPKRTIRKPARFVDWWHAKGEVKSGLSHSHFLVLVASL